MKTLINFLKFHFGKPNNQKSYVEMRRDYILSKFDIVNKVCKLNSLLNPKYKIQKSEGVLGRLDNVQVNAICKQIEKDGYYIFPKMLSVDLIEQIKEFASNQPINYLMANEKNISYSNETVRYAESKGLSNRYQILNIFDFRHSPASLQIATDPNLLHIANNYLGSKPILDLIIFWWSRSLNDLKISNENKEILKNSSAQMFHIDMDRLKFLKFFLYLTDVDTNTGPHVYVRGTNKKIPNYIKKDGRYSDSFIEENDRDNILEINGKTGTIMAVDTRGLHKGKELEYGERLIFQIEFSNSLFGNPHIPILNEKFKYTGNQDYFETYKLFFKK